MSHEPIAATRRRCLFGAWIVAGRNFLLHGSEILAMMTTSHLEPECLQPSIPPPYWPAPARLPAWRRVRADRCMDTRPG